MNKLNIQGAGVAVSATLAVLVGCSAGPSESEIAEAIQKLVPSMKVGGEELMTVSKVKKIGCSSTEGGYNCDVEWTVKGMGQEQAQVQRLRFVKGSQGWAATGLALK